MNFNFKKIFLLFAFLQSAFLLIANEDKNLFDYIEDAREQNKSIALIITDSRENSPCLEFNSKILKSEKFLNFAKEKLIIWKAEILENGNLRINMADEQTAEIPADQVDMNKFALEFGYDAPPAILLMNSEGEFIFRTNKPNSSPDAFISSLNAAIRKNEKVFKTLPMMKEGIENAKKIKERKEWLKKEGFVAPKHFIVSLNSFICPYNFNISEPCDFNALGEYFDKTLLVIGVENGKSAEFEIPENADIGKEGLKFSIKPSADKNGERILAADFDLALNYCGSLFRLKDAYSAFNFNRIETLAKIEIRRNVIEMRTGERQIAEMHRIITITFVPIFESYKKEENFLSLHRTSDKKSATSLDYKLMQVEYKSGNKEEIFVKKEAFLDLKYAASATVSKNYMGDGKYNFQVNVVLKKDNPMGKETRAILEEDRNSNSKQAIAIILDGKVISAPNIQSEITGSFSITLDSFEQAQKLAERINKYTFFN